MKIKNGKDAVIPKEKLTEYCLSPNHPRGKHKAILFKRILDIDPNNYQVLYDKIKTAAIKNEAIFIEKDEFGDRYQIDFEFQKDQNVIIIRSLWIIKKNEEIPRFCTCYVLRK